ncbi:hypothetical protein [Halorubrum yunnanense]|uniref:Uncharacterized protein n=1 Tax=Halorubrum yunnanense TaxID=1526162 RepID=A0ABD5YEJ0_9EURY|nr:hypothetical protein [Halorubrum yunnanense]
MTPSPSRRRLLAAAVPGLLAGCLVESDESADGGAGPDAADGSDSGGGDATGDDSTDGEGASAGDSTAQQTGDEPVPDEVGPDGAGLVVTNADVRGVTDDGYETTVDARLIVENAGRFTYGTVEFRVDAYATRPNSPDRDSVGFAYVTRRFTSGNRFDDGTRRFDVSITFRSRETNARADVDWYEVDAAVRRAEPV